MSEYDWGNPDLWKDKIPAELIKLEREFYEIDATNLDLWNEYVTKRHALMTKEQARDEGGFLKVLRELARGNEK